MALVERQDAGTRHTRVRTGMVLAQPAPPGETGTGLIKKNLFATPADSVLTIIGLLLVAYIVRRCCAGPSLTRSGRSRPVRLRHHRVALQPDGWSGACCFVNACSSNSCSAAIRMPNAGARSWSAMFVALLVPLLIPKVPNKTRCCCSSFPVFAYILLTGGRFGLPHVETPL